MTKPTRKNPSKELRRPLDLKDLCCFGEFDHGSWLSLFDINSNPQLGVKRIILGNPLIAITMLSQSTKSLDAGLFVPVEILVRQLSDEEGTEIMWQVPSTLIAALNRGYNELLNAAHVLDRKLEGLIAFIGRDV
ncbi:hypothetical protein BPOR_0280g00020 [Botrytis porri]|uniref:Uncharacterized protein n=1 Tax=Botrytis porri TaxID=87229 RepID=A0A4Z1KKZ1_9HELO|nr:hypothetical protein BPOR_0280g00020 [Botrytis porri]